MYLRIPPLTSFTKTTRSHVAITCSLESYPLTPSTTQNRNHPSFSSSLNIKHQPSNTKHQPPTTSKPLKPLIPQKPKPTSPLPLHKHRSSPHTKHAPHVRDTSHFLYHCDCAYGRRRVRSEMRCQGLAGVGGGRVGQDMET